MSKANNNVLKNERAAKKMSQAKMRLMLNAPFWGGLAVRFPMIEDYNCETAWIDGKNIGYNPAWIDELNVKECEGLIAHEVGHVLFMHHLRRGNRDYKTWNEAGDYVINLIVRDSGLTLPPEPLLSDDYRGASTEVVYDTLQQEKVKQNKQQQDKQDKDQDTSQDTDQGNQGVEFGEVRDYPGDDGDQEASQAEINQHEAEIKVMIAQAAMSARAAGIIPAGLSRVINGILDPAISLSSYLRQFIDRSCQTDYTFIRPNLRYSAEFIMPSLQADGLNNIIFAVDTSGSVGKDELNQYAAIITDTLEEFHKDAMVIYCDTRVYEDAIEHYSRYDLPVKLNPRGHGGTKFKPVFDYVKENDLSPLCLVYFTDLEGDFDDIGDPDYPVLWVQYDKYRWDSRLTPKVGDVIRIKDIG